MIVPNQTDGSADAQLVEVQKSYWSDVDVEHFRWQTQAGYIAQTEAALLDGTVLEAGERFLEIGCGEGGNLYHLPKRGQEGKIFGVDFSLPKLRFAAGATGALVAMADAARLPYRRGSFDAVLIRDLLHHVPDRGAVLAEAVRVLRPGGRLTVIEPNGRNPIIAAMALAIRAERGMLTSTLRRVEGELRAAGVVNPVSGRRQAMPLSRVVLHYRMGVPSLGNNRPVAWLLGALERVAELLPPSVWAYFIVRGTSPEARAQPSQPGH